MVETQYIVSLLEYYFKWAAYPAFDYFKLKSFFDQVIQKGNEKIVLTKINSGS